MSSLPCVTKQTYESLEDVMQEPADAYKTLVDWLADIDEENPELGKFLRLWMQEVTDERGRVSPRVLSGPVYMYQLLRAQAAVDDVTLPI